MTEARAAVSHLSGLDANLRDALARIAATSELLVALDFDGTLALEVDNPQAARAIPLAASAIERLVTVPRTRVALVSGRAIESLEAVARVPDDVLLVGSHGVEFHHDGHTELLLDPIERAQLDALRSALTLVTDALSDVYLEKKPAGFAVHTRVATPEQAAAASSRSLAAAVAAAPTVTVRRGKNVLEFSVRATTKGDALERLRRFTKATAVFFAGDDVTDEDAFSVLGPDDLGIKCGPGATQAAYRVETPAQVAAVLHVVADLRA